MTEYPTGVYVNMATPNFPANPEELAPSTWCRFSDQADADKGFGMIDAVCDNAVMIDAETLGGIYAQYIYTKVANAATIHCRIVNATARDEDGPMKICEYPSAILDRDSKPLAFVDQYAEGQPHVLKVQRINSTHGQLYFDAA